MNGDRETIPKIIHYCWFGKKQKPKLVQTCIESWQKNLPHFVIREWNESNYDITTNPFTRRMYEEKKWAFVADYVRLEALSHYGGVYLDTDMEIVKDISPLMSCELLLGKESENIISAGMIGAIPHHPYIQTCKDRYDAITGVPPTIPRLITDVYDHMKNNLKHTTVCEPEAFYPYSQETISRYKGTAPSPLTFGIHLWNYSWGHPVLRFANKVPAYHATKKILDMLGLKRALKKLFKLS